MCVCVCVNDQSDEFMMIKNLMGVAKPHPLKKLLLIIMILIGGN